jgi:pyruvate/2-oxoglutarate dehydrogenase complex dihydrolipoamide dehydrogenase (E3) component
MEQVDAIIIGSGQGGVPLAVALTQQGKKVVLFERSRRLGGSCVNWGCTPSKAFLAAAHAAGRARAAGPLGVHVQIKIDVSQVLERVRKVRDSFIEGVEKRIRQTDMTVVQAEAAFTSEGDVQGGGHLFCAPLVIINTGSSALIPPLSGLDAVPYLTDRNFWDLEVLPQRTIVLGGGYIGLELGQALARLGSEVHLIDRGDRILSTEVPDVSSILEASLEKDGVRFHLQAEAERVEYVDGIYRLYIQDGAMVEGEALLVAAGRQPNTNALNAPAAGIELDEKGYIKVNERLETTRSNVYAIGDAARQPAFTHVSWEDHRRMLDLLHGRERTRDDRVLGYALFTEPQVGRAGLSLAQAQRKNLRVRQARMAVKNMARAIEWGHNQGFYEMIIDEDTGRILGATLVGYEASELVHVFVDLIEAEATWELLADAQHIHPTYAENLPSLARMFKE